MYTYIQMPDRRLLLGLLCALGRLNFGVGLSRPLRGDRPLLLPVSVHIVIELLVGHLLVPRLHPVVVHGGVKLLGGGGLALLALRPAPSPALPSTLTSAAVAAPAAPGLVLVLVLVLPPAAGLRAVAHLPASSAAGLGLPPPVAGLVGAPLAAAAATTSLLALLGAPAASSSSALPARLL